MKENRNERTKLEKELRGKQARVEELRALRQDAISPPLLQALQEEKHRCERYNHYFALVTAASQRISAEDVLRRIKNSLRASDIVGIQDGEGRYHRFVRPPNELEQTDAAGGPPRNGRIAMILPETDRKDAESVVRRLSGLVTAEEQVTFRVAVYPNESNTVEELLAIATG